VVVANDEAAAVAVGWESVVANDEAAAVAVGWESVSVIVGVVMFVTAVV